MKHLMLIVLIIFSGCNENDFSRAKATVAGKKLCLPHGGIYQIVNITPFENADIKCMDGTEVTAWSIDEITGEEVIEELKRKGFK